MAKAYWIVRVSVRNPEEFPAYLAAARPAFEKYGARFIVRGGRHECMEGQCRPATWWWSTPTWPRPWRAITAPSITPPGRYARRMPMLIS